MKGEMDRAWKRVAASGWFILGKEVGSFEKEFAHYVGVTYAVGVGNGTEALQLALVAGGVGPGDEVITVANTAVPTVNAISAAGAKPVFVDIDPKNYTMDPRKIRDRISPRTKAIIPVHLYGHPADMDSINRIARAHRLMVIEDAAQAHGALYKGKKVGTLAHMGCFSFYPSKNLGAYGDAGMVVTNDKKLFYQLLLLRNHGQSKRYVHAIQGFNSRLDELQAAILRQKLKKLDTWNQKRRRWAVFYSRKLKSLPIILPSESSWSRHCYHLFVIRMPQRDQLLKWLARRKVQALVHYPIPVYLQKAYQELGVVKGSFPVTEECCRQVLSLPLYPELKEREAEKVVKVIQAFFRQSGLRI